MLEIVSEELLLAIGKEDDKEIWPLESAELLSEEMLLEDMALEEIATGLLADELESETEAELSLPPQALSAQGKAQKIIFTMPDLIVFTSYFLASKYAKFQFSVYHFITHLTSHPAKKSVSFC